MLGNGRKTIGVFVTQIHQEYQDILSRGICSQAKERGYNVAFFSNFRGYGELKYEAGEKSVADLPCYEDLDGIIVAPDTMFVQGFLDRIKENTKKYSKCPVVSVRQKLEDAYNVLANDDMVLDEIIYHFVKLHKYKKINFLSGPKDNPVSIQRLASYRRIMDEYNIPYKEDQIYYGDFWKYAPYEAVKQWFDGQESYPEAIICANDYMALSVINALAERGISVPKDVAVSGFDNIDVAEDFNPSLTTAGMMVFEMGIEAVEKIYRHIEGIPQEPISYLKSITYFRESCGCKTVRGSRKTEMRRNRIIDEAEAKDKAISNNAHMSVDLTGVVNLEVLYNKLASYAYLNEGFSSFYLCLDKDWDVYPENPDTENQKDTEHILMEVGIKNGDWLQRVEFNKCELLPSVYIDSEPQFFFFNIIHHQEKRFGYTAISFHTLQAYKRSYQGWIINVSNTLENIRMHSELNRLLYKLEDMYVKDELTGLYNRRGLLSFGRKYLLQSREEHNRLMVFSADMDNLKDINDNFGHAAGDVAIKAVADALLYASQDDEVCIRMGGDEFAVIGIEYNEEKMEHFVKCFEDSIRSFNRAGNHVFKVEVSYGWSITLPNEYTQVEDCLGIADSKMYQQKYQKEALRLKHLE